MKLKSDAELHLKQQVNDCVISVPNSFNMHQKQATRDAAALAKLNVLRLIHSTEAAIAQYENDKTDAWR